MLDTFKLRNPADVAALVAISPQGGVLIIDTLARAGDDDPNDAKERALIIEHATALSKAINGLVVLVGHTGKDVERGMSGSKKLFDAADAAIAVSRNGDERLWKADKVKDGEDQTEHKFS